MGSCFSSPVNSRNHLHPGASSRHVSSERKSPASSVPITQGENEILQSATLKCFAYIDLKKATRNFRPSNVVGEGGFWCVYKGWIDEHSFKAATPGTGMAIAVKRFNQDGFEGNKEWLAQINYLGQLDHPNLEKLIGYCNEDRGRFLIYEFIPRGSLENHLFRRRPDLQPLSWSIRMKIALSAAKGLAYLHGLEISVIYRDFKASDILLDLNYYAKLSDFGIAKDELMDMGTSGYSAPEYIVLGRITTKSDVYSFGVVLLEIITGGRVIDKNRPQGEDNLIEWARTYIVRSKRRVVPIMDPRIEGQYTIEGAWRAATLAVKCLAAEHRDRPPMDEVVKALEQLQVLQESGSEV